MRSPFRHRDDDDGDDDDDVDDDDDNGDDDHGDDCSIKRGFFILNLEIKILFCLISKAVI